MFSLEDTYEQPLHLLWTLLPLIAFSLIPVPILNGVVAALLFALPRELVDQWPIERPWDTVKDLVFFALGGATASAIIHWGVN
jgi:hypothetical protein